MENLSLSLSLLLSLCVSACLFNGISAFLVLFNAKFILLEEQ